MSSIFLFWWTSSCWVRLCSSSYVLAQTPPLLFYSGNLIIFSLIVTLFYLYPLLPLNSSLTFSQGSSWHLDLLPSVFSECSGHWSLTLEEPAWDGTFEETHIHPEYFLLIWGASLWRCFSLGVVQVMEHCDRCCAVGATVLEIGGEKSAESWTTWICSWPFSQQKVL